MPRCFPLASLGVAAVFAAAPVWAQKNTTDKPLPPGGVSILGDDPLARMTLEGPAAAQAKRTEVAVSIPGAPQIRRGVRLETTKPIRASDAVQLALPTTQNFGGSDVLFIRFWARTVSSTIEGGEGRIQITLKDKTPQRPPGFFPKQATPDSAWERFDYPSPTRAGLKAGEGVFALNFGNTGTGTQTIEIAGLEVLNYGKTVEPGALPFKKSTYEGREANAPWRKAAQERIEKHRKGDLTVRVVDKNGKPMQGAQIKVDMTRHAFAWGTETEGNLLQNTPDYVRYRKAVTTLFNETVPGGLKWVPWSNQKNRAQALKSIAWHKEQGMRMRGHNLVWPSWRYAPPSVKKEYERILAAQGKEAAKTYLRQTIEAHIREVVGATKGMLYEWDVVNETIGNHDFMDILGREVLADWFRIAHEVDPQALLYLNDNSLLTGKKVGDTGRDKFEHFADDVRLIQKHGGPIGAIGEQGHGGAIGVGKLLAGLDRMATLKLPIKITEFDIVTPDEELQVDWTRDYMTAVFSHPQTVGFTMWGFWDGKHWLGDAPLYYRNWTEKPSGKAYRQLVYSDWWTKANGKTNTTGQYQTRGFLGDYAITVSHNGKTATAKTTLTKNSPTVQITLP